MKQHEFLKLEEQERVDYVNHLLEDTSASKLSQVALKVGMSSSNFSKKMSGGAYMFSRSLKQYIPKDKRDNSASTEEVISYLKGNFQYLKEVIKQRENIEEQGLVLSQEVIGKGEHVVKNIRIPKYVNERFAKLCDERFSYLKLQDIHAQALWDFIERYK